MADINSTTASGAQSRSTSSTGTAEGSNGGDHGIVGRVKERAAAELSAQKNMAFDGIGSVAQAVRQSTQHLREQKHDMLAGYVEQAADQIEHFAQQLRGKDVNELFDDAQRLARRQPAIFIGSAFALGLIGARFFKSSPQDARSQYSGSPNRRDWSNASDRTGAAANTYSSRSTGQPIGSAPASASGRSTVWDTSTPSPTRTTTEAAGEPHTMGPTVSTPGSNVSSPSAPTGRSPRAGSSGEKSK